MLQPTKELPHRVECRAPQISASRVRANDLREIILAGKRANPYGQDIKRHVRRSKQAAEAFAASAFPD
jgi:hypothetical protein